MNDLWEYDIHDSSWRLLHAIEPSVPSRIGQAAIITKDFVITVGG